MFEPNDEKLWTQLRIAVSNFLTRPWNDGPTVRLHPQAFYESAIPRRTRWRTSRTATSCEIGITPVKPAEFVSFRLSQFSGGEGSAVSA